jgi:hypothetical protein
MCPSYEKKGIGMDGASLGKLMAAARREAESKRILRL